MPWRLKDVWAMLKECAPGYTRKEGRHNWSVYYQGEWAMIPTGKHGKKPGRAEVEKSHIVGLLRKFEIEECGKAFLGI